MRMLPTGQCFGDGVACIGMLMNLFCDCAGQNGFGFPAFIGMEMPLRDAADQCCGRFETFVAVLMLLNSAESDFFRKNGQENCPITAQQADSKHHADDPMVQLYPHGSILCHSLSIPAKIHKQTPFLPTASGGGELP